jgi:hypothetical protein
VGGSHDVVHDKGRVRECDKVDPTGGTVREAAQRGLTHGGITIDVGMEDQAGPVKERGSANPRVCLVGGTPGAAGDSRCKQI